MPPPTCVCCGCFTVFPLPPNVTSGRCRIIAGFLSNAPIPPTAAKLSALLEPLFHCGQNQVLDSDGMILHVQVSDLHTHQGCEVGVPSVQVLGQQSDQVDGV